MIAPSKPLLAKRSIIIELASAQALNSPDFTQGASNSMTSSNRGMERAIAAPLFEVSKDKRRPGSASFRLFMAGVLMSTSSMASSLMHKIFLASLQLFKHSLPRSKQYPPLAPYPLPDNA